MNKKKWINCSKPLPHEKKRKKLPFYDLKPRSTLHVSKAGPAHFTKYITTVIVCQATSHIHAQITSSNSDLESCLQFDHSSCAFPLPRSQVSIFNSGLGLHFLSLEWARPLTTVPVSPHWWRLLQLRCARKSGKCVLKSFAPHSHWFLRRQCADKAPNFHCWFAPALHHYSSHIALCLCFSITTKEHN